jgi:hypothetical protein
VGGRLRVRLAHSAVGGSAEIRRIVETIRSDQYLTWLSNLSMHKAPIVASAAS